MKRVLAISAAMLLLIGTPAMAQGGQGRGQDGARGQGRGQQQRMSEEETQAAWTAQATGVAKQAGADEEATKKLVEAYTNARKGLNDKMQEAREAARGGDGAAGGGGRGGAGAAGGGAGGGRGGAGGRGGFAGANNELTDAARTELATKVTEILGNEKGDTAMAALGTFSAQWDRMVHSVVGFKLEGEANAKALASVQSYIVGMDKLRSSDDRQAMREGFQELQEELNSSLDEVLDDEQMEAFNQANRLGRGGRGGAGGGRRGGGGGGGGGGGRDIG